MNISFPQKLFISPKKENIVNGKDIAKQSKILFCGIARNVSKTLKKNIDRINYLGQRFKEHDIFIYENDSLDNTKEIIKQSNINFISEHREDEGYWNDIESGKTNNHLNRCNVLAKCRNIYIDYALQNRANYDYLCVLDWDIKGWSYKGFFDSIFRLENDLNKNLYCVSAYGVLSDFHNNAPIESTIGNLLMYDSFAFRPSNDIVMNDYIQSQFNYYKCIHPSIVRSNFGGMSIYKMKIALDHRYKAELNNGFVDCDHVCFHESMNSTGLFNIINPYLVVSYSKHRFDND